jgi:hypothetical protein
MESKIMSMSHSSWRTSASALAAVPSPHDLSALGEHLHLCRAPGGRLFAVRCGAEALHRFVAARFVTSLVVAVLLIGVGSLVP